MRDPGYDSSELDTVEAELLPPVIRDATLADRSPC
jgi:hypothetical protein